MNIDELGARTAVLMQVMASCGVTDEARIVAMVGLTLGIPWYIPPRRHDPTVGGLLFPLAAKEAANRCTHGAVKPADILEAALSIDGHITSDQGHISERRWVKEARLDPEGVGVTLDAMLALPGPGASQARLMLAAKLELELEPGGK